MSDSVQLLSILFGDDVIQFHVFLAAVGLMLTFSSLQDPKASASEYIYWTENGSGTGPMIRRATLDGSTVENLVTNSDTSLINPFGIAIDPDAGLLYWSDLGTNDIKSANLDGSNIQTVYSSSQVSSVFDLDFDAHSGQLYWIEIGSTKAVKRGNADGTGTIESLVTGGLVNPRGLGVDVAGNTLFLSEGSTGSDHITSANLNGAASSFISPVLSPVDIDVYSDGGTRLVWADSFSGTISTATTSATDFQSVVSGEASLGEFTGLALAPDSDILYWTIRGDGTGRIRSRSLDGTGSVTEILGGLGDPRFLVVGPDATAELSVSSGDGGSLSFSQVRIGASSDLLLSITNTGHGGSVLNGEYAIPTDNEFYRSGGDNFSVTTGSSSRTYTYSPVDRLSDNETLTITSDAGHASFSLQGEGVGPEFELSGIDVNGTAVELDVVNTSEVLQSVITISNSSPDGDLDGLTDLTLLSYSVTGFDSDHFDVLGLVPGTVLSAGESINLSVLFDTISEVSGDFTATVTIVTDQNAQLGSNGKSFAFEISARLIPEPTTLALFALLLPSLLLGRARSIPCS